MPTKPYAIIQKKTQAIKDLRLKSKQTVAQIAGVRLIRKTYDIGVEENGNEPQ